jgi:hypothetical protein
MEDMNPIILRQFNNLMAPIISSRGIDKNKWLPVVKQNMKAETLYAANYGQPAKVIRDNSFDESYLGKANPKNGIYPSAMTNGELPIAALVDGRQFGTTANSVKEDRPRYKLRWYGIPKGA